MDPVNEDELIANFTEVTGVDPARGRFFLEASRWKIDTALASFYEAEHDQEGEGIGPVGMLGDDSDTEADSTPRSQPPMSVISSLLAAASPIPPQGLPHGPPIGLSSGPHGPSNFASVRGPGNDGYRRPKFSQPGQPTTLDSLRQQQESGGESSDEETHGQAFYAGGSESSGQQVLGPPKKREDLVAEMFKKAREHGAEEVMGGLGGGGKSKKPSQFGGTGYKLGESSDDTVVIPSPGSLKSGGPGGGESQEVVLRLWSTGFTINDGPFREYTDPANMPLLNSIKRGEIPQELVRAANGQEVQLAMEDHRTEDYKPPAPVSRPFAGRGQMLGSPVPPTVGSTVSGGEGDRVANELAAQSAVSLSSTEPTTNITFRLVDGTRLRAQFNHTHTVNDLYEFVNTARPHLAASNYVLTFFPNKELTKKEETVKEANVLNAALIQKIK